VRDRAAAADDPGRIRFSSMILPPYMRRSKSIEALLPILYLKGISTGDFSEALAALLGKDAAGLSASTISRLKEGSLALNVQRASRLLSDLTHCDLLDPASSGGCICGNAKDRAPLGEQCWTDLYPHDALAFLARLMFANDGDPLPVLPFRVQLVGINEQLPKRRPILLPIPSHSDDGDLWGSGHV
jgi:hypothetical protein